MIARLKKNKRNDIQIVYLRKTYDKTMTGIEKLHRKIKWKKNKTIKQGNEEKGKGRN